MKGSSALRIYTGVGRGSATHELPIRIRYFLFFERRYRCTGVLRENPQGGGVFIHPFNVGLTEIKTPPPPHSFINNLETLWFSKNTKRGAVFIQR